MLLARYQSYKHLKSAQNRPITQSLPRGASYEMQVRASPFNRISHMPHNSRKGSAWLANHHIIRTRTSCFPDCVILCVFLPSSLVSLSRCSELIAPFWPGKPCRGELPALPMLARCTHSDPLAHFTCTISAPKTHATPQKVLLTIEPNHAEYDNAKGYINMLQ